MANPEILAAESFLDGKVTLFGGDNRAVLRSQGDCSVDSIVTDPPYALESIVKRFGGDNAAPASDKREAGAFKRTSAGFMGKKWDTGEVAFAPEFWAECKRVLKPGGHVVAFSGTRTYHRLASAIEDAGFDIRDQLAWCYGSGFPKSHDVAKGIDKRGGKPHLAAEIGVAIKGARERRGLSVGECDKRFCRGSTNWSWFEGRAAGQRAPTPETFAAICDAWPELLPLASAVAEVERAIVGKGSSGIAEAFGDGEWNTDRQNKGFDITAPATDAARAWEGWGTALKPAWEPICLARKPLDGTVAGNVLAHGVGALNIGGCWIPGGADGRGFPANVLHDGSPEVVAAFANGEESAARFFYTAKADAHDRAGSKHPTVKPVDLMQWAVRLVTPPGGVTLDPFAGTGTTGEAAFREGMRAILIEREAEYQDDIRRRMRLALAGPDERRRESIKAKEADKPFAPGSLFEGL